MSDSTNDTQTHPETASEGALPSAEFSSNREAALAAIDGVLHPKSVDAADTPEPAPERDPPADGGETKTSPDAPGSPAEPADETLTEDEVGTLLSSGWTADEIREAIDKRDRGFFRLAKQHHQRVELAETQAAIQAARAAGQKPPQESGEAPASTASQAGLPTSLDLLDGAKLGEEIGDPDIGKAIAEKLNGVIEGVNKVLAQTHETSAATTDNNTDAAMRAANQFFESAAKENPDLYGTGDLDNLSEEQFQARAAVLSNAYDIVAGRRILNPDAQVSINDALNEAHRIVSYDHTRETERNRIRRELTERARGASLPPNTRSTTSEQAEKPKNRADAMAAGRSKALEAIDQVLNRSKSA